MKYRIQQKIPLFHDVSLLYISYAILDPNNLKLEKPESKVYRVMKAINQFLFKYQESTWKKELQAGYHNDLGNSV